MKAAICTLYERDYHYGVGVLSNSLFVQGFQGVIWVGYRGALPPWATPIVAKRGYQEFVVATDCVLRFVEIQTDKFLSNYKPDFMLDVLDRYAPEIDALYYFDPDIVNKRNWQFYEQWVHHGIALCEDWYDRMPARHPYRLMWLELAQRYGFTRQRELDWYYNSGFIGLHRREKGILLDWQKLLEMLELDGLIDLKQFQLTRGYPYFQGDQCVFNLALMVSTHPLSPIGCRGMDFGGVSLDLMSHAAGAEIKPWRKSLIKSALRGMVPSLTDKAYWRYACAPIPVYSKQQQSWKQFAIKWGAAIGRLIR
jgi:hypothetical protein